jgi:hypothetical protein
MVVNFQQKSFLSWRPTISLDNFILIWPRRILDWPGEKNILVWTRRYLDWPEKLGQSWIGLTILSELRDWTRPY